MAGENGGFFTPSDVTATQPTQTYLSSDTSTYAQRQRTFQNTQEYYRTHGLTSAGETPESVWSRLGSRLSLRGSGSTGMINDQGLGKSLGLGNFGEGYRAYKSGDLAKAGLSIGAGLGDLALAGKGGLAKAALKAGVITGGLAALASAPWGAAGSRIKEFFSGSGTAAQPNWAGNPYNPGAHAVAPDSARAASQAGAQVRAQAHAQARALSQTEALAREESLNQPNRIKPPVVPPLTWEPGIPAFGEQQVIRRVY